MSLDIGLAKVLNNPRDIPGPSTIRVMAASFGADRTCGARYVFADGVPLAFDTPEGPQRAVFKQPPFVLTPGERQPVDMDVQVVPAGGEVPAVAQIIVEISEIDAAGKPVGTMFRTSAVIRSK